MKRATLAALTLALNLALVATATAAVPGRITEQGRLFMKGTSTPTSGSVPMIFSVYAAASGGTALWTESYNVTLDDGYYSVQLGSKTAFPATLWDGSVRYIGLKVGSDEEMMPREEVAAAPYALVAGDVTGDIHPTSVSVAGKTVIDAAGKWVGEPTGLQGAKGDKGDPGAMGTPGAPGTPGQQGMQGIQGMPGMQGMQGIQGIQGPPGVPCTGCVTKTSIASGALNHTHTLSVQVVMSPSVAPFTTIGANGGVEVFATCPGGTILTGGGCNFGAGTSFGGLRLISSYPGDFNNADPSLRGNRWTCGYENVSTGAPTVRAYALCASIAQVSLP
jgi:hypothetical protein